MQEPGSLAETETRPERTETGRLDSFVDGAFAFAITLLVISGSSLPRSVTALEQALRGVPAFACCFAQLAWFWHAHVHVHWRDNVGLTDRRSLILSLLLVFFALIFVFPLHLVYSGMFNSLSNGALSPEVTLTVFKGQGSLAALFTCYGLSWTCMAGTLAALYRHGISASWMQRDELISTRLSTMRWAYIAALGLVSVLFALGVHRNLYANVGQSVRFIIPGASLAGWIYGFMFFLHPIMKYYRKHLEARLPA